MLAVRSALLKKKSNIWQICRGLNEDAMLAINRSYVPAVFPVRGVNYDAFFTASGLKTVTESVTNVS